MTSYETRIPVRFRDIDAMGHVNNAVYATYFEQARADYFRDVLGEALTDVDTVLVSLSVDYRRPIEPDQTVTVAVEVDRLGESSITMTYEIVREDGATAAEGETVQVAFDPAAETSRPLPEEWRTTITEYHGL